MKKSFYVLFYIFLFFEGAYAAHCEKEISNPAEQFDFKRVNLEINKLIKSSSQNAIVAKDGDALLSKLIAAKSPVIVNWIKKRNLDFNKPEILVKSWREYYFKSFILSRYKEQPQAIKDFSNSVFHKVNQIAFNNEIKTRINKVFKKSKKYALLALDSFNMDKELIALAKKRVNNIKLYWLTHLEGSKFENYPLEFLEWTVAYDPLPNEINIGTKALKYKTEEDLFAVFAHEIGHSIDSCRWKAFINKTNPFSNINKCLRSKESGLNALRRDDSKMDELIKLKKMSKDLAASLRGNTTCNKKNYPPIGTQKDQLPETFADWFSAEVVALGVSNFKTLRSDLCEKRTLQEGSSYLSNNKRLNRIYLNQPIIRKGLGLKLKSDFNYCNPKI